MLLNHMGRDACLAGVKRFIEHYSTDPDHPVLQDFVASMRPFASDPAAFDEFVHAWFFDVVLPEYRLTDATAVSADAAGDASWRVTVSLLPGAVFALLLLWRTVVEDRSLHEHFDGYADYARQVPHRLVPGLW